MVNPHRPAEAGRRLVRLLAQARSEMQPALHATLYRRKPRRPFGARSWQSIKDEQGSHVHGRTAILDAQVAQVQPAQSVQLASCGHT
jgi:hypothetical protein